MNHVLCPHCGKQVELSEALTHQMRETVRAEQAAKHKQELEKTKLEAEERALKKAKDELELKLKNSQTEAEEVEKRNRELQEQLLEITKAFRELQQKDKDRELEMQKVLLKERERMEIEIGKNVREKADLETAELRKQLEDTKKALEDAQRKADQKSQQLQGEVLELELENLLRATFSHDSIEAIGKGTVGADIRQIVKSPLGTECGIILWEFKRTKDWQNSWIPKLKKDMLSEKANIAVIVSLDLPKEAENGVGQIDGVIICSQSLVIPITTMLRKNLLDVGRQKAIAANKESKAETLYSYITSHEFQQQIENVIEAYKEIQNQILKERVAFEKMWKQREVQAQRIILSAANVIGHMQGVVGSSMPQIKGLDLPQLDSADEQQSLLE